MSRHTLSWLVTLIALITLLAPSTANADERENIMQQIEELHNKIEIFHNTGRTPPEEITRKIEMLEQRLIQFDQQKQFQAQHEKVLQELQKLEQQIQVFREHGKQPPAEIVARHQYMAETLQHLEQGARNEPGIEWALRILSELNPPEAEHLRNMLERDPREFQEHMQGLIPWLEEMDRLHREEPEIFELHVKLHRLEFNCDQMAEAAHNTKGPEREKIRNDLRAKLKELFETALTLRRHEIRQLENELEELRSHVEKMDSQAEQMIERRLNNMLNQDEEW